MSNAVRTYTSIGMVLLVVLVAAGIIGMSSAPEPAPPPEPAVAPPPVSDVPPRSLSDLAATPPVVYRWNEVTTADGLPSDKVFSVRVDGPRVWLGTDRGLALYEAGAVQRVYTTEDGLAHNSVLAIDVDSLTGTVWAATMAGLSGLSAGRFETYTQMNSGLANNMLYAVLVDGEHVWTASAAGASVLDTRTGQWRIHNEQNAPMHEPWTYGLASGDQKVYLGAWGGGLLEWDKATERWKDYVDPDGEMELDIFPDDGLVHDIVSSLSYDDGIVWVATYFGLSLYDGTRWKGYFDDTSGLASNFINFVRAAGPVGFLCTDRGLSAFDGRLWRTYTRLADGRGQIVVHDEAGTELRRLATKTALNHNFVLGVDVQGDTLWVATERGVARGTPERSIPLASLDVQ